METSSSAPASHKPGSASSERNFWLIAAALALFFAGMAFFYSDKALYGPRLNRELLVWPAVILIAALYWQGYEAVKTGAVSLKKVFLAGALVAFVAALIPPFHSTDMFGYINRGWQQLAYHLNPYVHTVDAIPNWERDPMITDHWVNNPSPYGFLYLLIAKTLVGFGQGSLALTVQVFKGFNFLMYLATAGVVRLGAKRLKLPQAEAVYLYLFNPLMLMQSLANGHNDILMGFFVLLAAYFAIARRWIWILPALTAATLIKYGAVVILPLAGLFLIKQKAWKALALGLLLSGVLFLATGAPYLPDYQQFHLKEIEANAFVSHGSLHSVFNWFYKLLAREAFPAMGDYLGVFRSGLKNLLLLGFAVYYAKKCWNVLRDRHYNEETLMRDSLLVMVVLVCVISLKFYPWYLGMFFPVALYLTKGDQLKNFLLLLSGFQLLGLTFIGQAHFLNYMLMTAVPFLLTVKFARKQALQELNG